MAKKNRKYSKETELPLPEDDIIGVDSELGLYELTDLFSSFYKYHNEDCQVEYTETNYQNNRIQDQVKTLSRFEVFRRIEAATLGSRPFMGNVGIKLHKPNINLGYLTLLLTYLRLPYKAAFTDNDFARIRINRKLYDINTLSEEELKTQKLEAQNNPNIVSNKEVGDDTSDAFNDVLRVATGFSTFHDVAPNDIVQNGFVAALHESPDQDYDLCPIEALDLITEPQCKFDPSTWGSFFIIRKMTSQQIVEKIKEPGRFWNKDALRWSLESSFNGKGVLNDRHYALNSTQSVQNENFSVKSFYSSKSKRLTNLNGYYGSMLVVEGYYYNTKGKVVKVIFFPSVSFQNVHKDERKNRTTADVKDLKRLGIDKADVLFKREMPFDDLSRVITVIPFDRSELTLERQRSYGHELFNICEAVMRIDSSILNTISLMGTAFIKNPNQGDDSQTLEDLDITVDGSTVDLGDRNFVESPFVADLKGMVSGRGLYIQHAITKCFLGGLDGTETSSEGRGANLANLRLIRDGRVHKHNIVDFAKGLKELYNKTLRSILEIIDNMVLVDELPVIKYLFLDTLTKLQGHPKTLFSKGKDNEILKETGLPYWITLEPIRNGASHFGAAEMVLYSEIKQVFGDGLNQQSLEALNRMGIKSLLGSQDATDILGDPKDNLVTQQDQIYRARLENAAILGSVDQGTINFEQVDTLIDKDDDVAHLAQVHNPKAEEIIKRINESDVASENEDDVSEQVLETRVNLILKLAALANHIALHQGKLDKFGAKRDDVNRLKEETNAILQSSEGLLNNLQNSLRALTGKRQDAQMRLQNLSPENEAEKMKQQNEFAKLQAKQAETHAKLLLANKLADQRQAQHTDKQLTKARDRKLKANIADRDAIARSQELATDAALRKMEIAASIVQKTTDSKEKNLS